MTWPTFDWESGAQKLVAVDLAYVAVFLATADSVSSPCGLGSEYYGSGALQVMDVINTYLRAALVLGSFAALLYAGKYDNNKAIATLYGVLSFVVVVLDMYTSFADAELNCPNAENLMGCDETKYWMVPRNYCKAQLALAQVTHGCNVLGADQDKTQMCVRLGRAPLVNGAFGAWVIRTVVCDGARLALVIWFMKTSNTGQVAPGNAQGSGDTGANDNDTNVNASASRAANEAGQQNDTLLAPAYDDGVIRQSPHVRKRASAAYKIDF